MKRTLLLFLSYLLATQTHAQIRAFAPRYSNTSVRGNIVYVANNIITTSGVSPYENPPGGTNKNNGAPGVNIDVTSTNSTIFNYGTTWKYLDNGSNQGTGWSATGFNDASWASGAAELGYGDAPVTTVSYGSNVNNKYITTYFRKTVNIVNPSSYSSFLAGIRRDDGCVVYVNGVQVFISNLTAPVAFNTLATNAADDGATPQTFTIPTSAFVNGTNVIAVEIHQTNATSSDLTFDMALTAVTNSGNTNASSADLNLPSCASVLWAGLYWGSTLGTSSQSSWRASRDTVKFKIPGAAGYTTVVSTQTDLHDSSSANNHTGYTAYANVTSLLNASSQTEHILLLM